MINGKQKKGVTIQHFIYEKHPILIKNYTNITEIASAAFGKIFFGIYKPNGVPRCIKIYNKNLLKNTKQLQFEEEVFLMRKFDHPNICKIYEFFQDEENYYLIQEFLAGGELFDFIAKFKSFSEKLISIIMEQILSAVKYLHVNNILHRDLKPENILLCEENNVTSLKLIDFGTSKIFTSKEKLSTPMGTCYYMAPEMLKYDYDERIDIWACGIIMHVLLVGYPPFNGQTDKEIFDNILNQELVFREGDWDKVTPDAINLVKKMLEKDPDKRISLEEVFKHRWFKVHFNINGNNPNKPVLERLKKFNSNTKLENALRIFLIQCYDMNNEKERLMTFFKECDKNHDGMLELEEIKNICSRNSFHFNLDEFIHNADVNCDGKINYSEFLMAAVDFKKKSMRDIVINIFRAIDDENKGYISKKSLAKFLNLMINDPILEEMFIEADKNKDNKLSVSEFMGNVNNLYE